MNTTAALAGIALIGTIAAVITGLAVSQMENINQIDPEIDNNNMYKVDDQLVVELVNRGEPLNTSKLQLLYNYHGVLHNHTTLGDMQREKNCLGANTTWPSNTEIECRTGIEFPQANNELELQIIYENDTKVWTATCKPSTTSAVGC